jgi:hypothetical protein
MKTLIFCIQPYQSKFTFWKVKANKKLGNLPIFSKMFESPINLIQIQNQVASLHFNSNYVWNLNQLQKGKLFLLFQATLMKSFKKIGVTEEGILYFTNLLQFGILKRNRFSWKGR